MPQFDSRCHDSRNENHQQALLEQAAEIASFLPKSPTTTPQQLQSGQQQSIRRKGRKALQHLNTTGGSSSSGASSSSSGGSDQQVGYNNTNNPQLANEYPSMVLNAQDSSIKKRKASSSKSSNVPEDTVNTLNNPPEDSSDVAIKETSQLNKEVEPRGKKIKKDRESHTVQKVFESSAIGQPSTENLVEKTLELSTALELSIENPLTKTKPFNWEFVSDETFENIISKHLDSGGRVQWERVAKEVGLGVTSLQCKSHGVKLVSSFPQ